jgi:prepilin-type processing-associated H-X9-DG protein
MVVVNPTGADNDFRVQSNGNANMLFVDASVDRVGVGATPMTNGSTFQVTSDSTESTNMQLTLRGASDTNKQMIMGFDTTANTAHITTQIAGSAPTPLIFKTGDVVFNEASSDSDFRVESNDNANMLFVDGGNNRVGIGKAAASQPFEVGVFSAFDTGMIVNESGADSDFRVESDTNTHMLFVDAGNNAVGIGTSSPSRKVSLADSVNGYNLELQQTSAYNSGNQSGIVFSAPYNIGGSVTDLASIRGGKENATDEDFGGKLAFYTRANGGSDTERMRIDSSGRVTMPYQPAFNVNPLSDQNNIAINTPVTVIFNSEVFDVGSNFASNTFTAPVTGKYQLNLALRLHNIDTAADFYQIKFLTSNRSYLSTADYGGLSSNPNYWTEAFSVLADMDANDTVSITVSQSGGSVQTDIHVETTFSGYLVA